MTSVLDFPFVFLGFQSVSTLGWKKLLVSGRVLFMTICYFFISFNGIYSCLLGVIILLCNSPLTLLFYQRTWVMT